MKIHLAWIRVTATAAVLAGVGAQPVAAQYPPYRPTQQPAASAVQPATTATPRVAAQQPYWQQAAHQAASPRYQTPTTAQYQQAQSQQAQYPQTSGAYVPTAPASVPSYSQSPAYAPNHAYTPTAAQHQAYPYVAYQPSETPPVPADEGSMPAPVQEGAPTNGATVNGMNGHVQNGHVQNGHAAPNGYAAGCNGNGNYPAGNYYTGDQACGDGYGIGEYFDNSCHESQWFGGVYYLFMERDRPSPQKVTVAANDTATYPYFPTATSTALVQSDHEYRSGVEIRFGSTFTIGDSCDTCDTGGYGGCNSCAPCNTPTVYAWEFAWWGLDDDVNDVTYVDQPTTGLHGMKNFAGLGYDRDGDTAIDNPVNGYYGYALPIPAASSEVLAQRVRTNFKAQNLELNIIRFPVCDVSCGGCDTGCNTGCDSSGCEPACAPVSTFSMYGACGVRYFRADDDFMYATEFNGGTQAVYDGWSYADDNELYYDVQVDNNLLGPQLGWTMNYCYGSKWNFFLNSTFGVFANHIEQQQSMFSGGGGAVYFYDPATGGTGERFDVESDKDDISFLGELRMGGSYDLSCHWRAVAAYRAVAMTGIATSTDQIPSDFTNPEWVAIIDSDNSMIVHGVQIGAECRY